MFYTVSKPLKWELFFLSAIPAAPWCHRGGMRVAISMQQVPWPGDGNNAANNLLLQGGIIMCFVNVPEEQDSNKADKMVLILLARKAVDRAQATMDECHTLMLQKMQAGCVTGDSVSGVCF